MFWHLIAAIVAGVAGAGIGLLLRSLTRKRLPKWIIPVCAGLGMLSYTIHYEYTWFETKQARLPEGSLVVMSEEGEMLWRPWTMIYPMPLAEKQHLTSTVKSASYQLICTERAMFRLNEAGQAKIETLTELEADSPLYQAICEAGR